MEPKCYRITIEGRTSFGIQGINLRERIEQTIKHPKDGKALDVNGRVRNLKDGRVEIICIGRDVNPLHKTLEEWNEIKHTVKEELYDPRATEFKDFTVERSDDLSEMVWALRGAGYRFVQSTETLETINRNILERDKKTSRGRLLTLHYELMHNIIELDEEIPNSDRISLEVIKSNAVSPVLSEEDFAHLSVQVFLELQRYQKDRDFRSTTVTLKENLTELRTKIDRELSTNYGIKMEEET